ncbi:FecCD family ABC transporter permease [Chitinimonas koreensis]|uniref:FecCD family ABC transporter permease n=1 Tax=Chitinimonas koreensis TaxID=356302 RepID=UPI00040BF170|nr:iron ABC transporter permease [Chitinimonas koreensis]QNM98313.1 iron ABC transporter permease [Chitinimonas koreensis]
MSAVRAYWRRPSLLVPPPGWRGLLAAALCAALLLFALGFAGDGWHWPDLADPLVAGLRVPRVLAALLVGGALGAAGAALQALFRNPLADPGLIGTSSGAALAAVGVMALGWGGIGLPLAAFLGGLVATVLLLALSRWLGGGEAGLLLFGLMLGSFGAAATGMLMFLSDDLTLRSAMSWLSGQLGSSTGAPLALAAPGALLGLAALIALGRDLDCLLLGEDEARSLGVAVERTRLLTAVAAALAVGAAVSVSGIIGFVGMMVPNACALLLGGGRRKLIAASAAASAFFLLLMDTLARGIAYPVNLPVGLLSAFIGPAFFLWLFHHRSKEQP